MDVARGACAVASSFGWVPITAARWPTASPVPVQQGKGCNVSRLDSDDQFSKGGGELFSRLRGVGVPLAGSVSCPLGHSEGADAYHQYS
jgi:hypothetical protein